MKEKIKNLYKEVFPALKYGFVVFIFLTSSLLFGGLCILLDGCSIVYPDGDVINGRNNLTIQVYQESVDK